MNEIETKVKADKDVDKKVDKKAENKVWLSQRIHEIGIENLLYPTVRSISHPYTKEVLLIAETQGYKQNTIATMCGVTQPQVSQWLDGQGKANLERITPLINKLSPIAPGDEFHIKTIVSETTIEFSEDWELQMLLMAYPEKDIIKYSKLDIDLRYYDRDRDYNSGRYSEYHSICASKENLEKSAIGSLEDEYKNLTQQVKKTFTADKELKERELNKLELQQANYIYEKNSNETLTIQYEADRATYLENNKPLLKLTAEDREEIISNNVPLPEFSTEEKIEYTDYLNSLSVTYNVVANPSDTKQIETLVEKITQELSLITCQFEEKILELGDSLTSEKLKKSIFGQFDQSIDMKVLVIDDSPELSVEQSIIELGNRLYGDMSHKLKVKIPQRNHYGSKKEDYEFEINMSEAFADYCNNLEKRFSTKTIQICGDLVNTEIKGDSYVLPNDLNTYKFEIIDELKELKDEIICELRRFSDHAKFNHHITLAGYKAEREATNTKIIDTSMDVQPVEFECYQLFSKRLLLIHNHSTEQSDFSYAYSADNAEIFLAQLTEIMIFHEYSKKEINEKNEEYKSVLLKRGYRLDSVESIY